MNQNKNLCESPNTSRFPFCQSGELGGYIPTLSIRIQNINSYIHPFIYWTKYSNSYPYTEMDE